MTVTSRRDRLTPDQVQSVSFPAARLGRRGFDEEHVRAFCAQVEGELVTLLNEKTALWEEVERLRRRMLGENGDAPGLRPEDAHIQAVHILSNAQQTADRYVADAQHYSRQLAEDARRRRDEVLEEDHQQGTRAAGAAMTGQVALTAGEQQELQTELAYLRTFSDVYRNHLRAYLEALLRNVADWEQAEKSSLSAARADLSAGRARLPLPPQPQPRLE
jgi:DivIVA domain-containing protein